ncbi:MAG TPA: hypothetical protein VMH30_00235 [Verrucomicrobiae bacterium]|nr:hypothetical protein [Verrucomicrobiae bacterium]
MQTENRALREPVAALRRKNTLLRQEFDPLARRLFRKKSGHLDAAQSERLLIGLADRGVELSETENDEPPVPARPRRSRSASR